MEEKKPKKLAEIECYPPWSTKENNTYWEKSFSVTEFDRIYEACLDISVQSSFEKKPWEISGGWLGK